MTTLVATRPTSPLARLIGRLTAWRASARAYGTTRRELSALSERELADLGIHRSMIEEIARQSARRS